MKTTEKEESQTQSDTIRRLTQDTENDTTRRVVKNYGQSTGNLKQKSRGKKSVKDDMSDSKRGLALRSEEQLVGRATGVETLQPSSITPFPNLDQVQSESTNLIDDTTKLLSEQMKSLAKHAKENENLFGTTQQVNAICTCAKNINALIRTKLDIFKSYKE